MPSYIYKTTSPTTVTAGTNVYAYTSPTTTSRVNYIKVWNGSAWVQVYQYDTTAPTIGNWSVSGDDSNQMTFSWSGGALVTDSESGVATVTVEYQYTPWGGSGEGWNSWQTWTSSQWAATSGSYSFTVSTAKRATQSAGSPGYYTISNRYYVDFRVTATDAVGNSVSKTIANGQLTRPYGTFYIVPQGSGSIAADSYETGNAFLGLSNNGVRSGQTTGTPMYSYGCWFYGDEIETYHLIKDASSNRYKADSGTLYIQRYQSSGVSGAWAFRQHNLRFSNGSVGATFNGNTLVAVPNISGADADRTFTLDSGHLSDFSTLTAKGFGMVQNGSTNYRVCRNYLQDLSASGQITLVFN